MFLNTVHFSLALALGHTSPRVSAENLACLPEFLLLGRPSTLFFFFWRGALLNTMRLLKSLLGLLASFYLASYNVALANALRRKAVKNVQLITSSLFTSFHMWPLVSWVLWLLIDAFKKLGFTPTSIYSFVFYSPFIVVWGGGWLDTCYSILAGVGAKLSLIFFAICIFI